MADTIAPPQTCRNCAAALAGPYCAQCGQKDRPLNPSLFSLAGDALAEMFLSTESSCDRSGFCLRVPVS